MNFIDLFAGIGGFHYGLDAASREKNRRGQEDASGNDEARERLESPKRKETGNQVGWNSDSSSNRVNQGSFNCVYSNEWDRYANSVYKSHFGECDDRDIRTVKAEEIPDFELLCGGFPCQSFSIAGKRGGFGDTRGTLFFEIARIASVKRPRLLLLENVKGLLSHDQGRTFGTILSTLDELGYDCQWQVLNSKNFGVPQNRERVFIIGHLRGTPRPQVFPLGNFNPTALDYVGGILSERAKMWLDNGKKLSRNFPQGSRVYSDKGISATLASQAGGLGAKTGLYKTHPIVVNRKEGVKRDTQLANTLNSSDWRGLNRNQDQTAVMVEQVQEIMKKSRPNEEIEITFKENGDIRPHRTDKKKSGVSELAINHENNVSNTVSASHAPKVYRTNDVRIRKLTPIECERLQGFPDDWTKYGHDGQEMSDTQRYKMMGNAVTTNVISLIAQRLR